MTHDYRVMIADDDPDVQLLLSRKLSRQAVEVTAGWDGSELLTQCAREFRESCAAVPTEVERHC